MESIGVTPPSDEGGILLSFCLNQIPERPSDITRLDFTTTRLEFYPPKSRDPIHATEIGEVQMLITRSTEPFSEVCFGIKLKTAEILRFELNVETAKGFQPHLLEKLKGRLMSWSNDLSFPFVPPMKCARAVPLPSAKSDKRKSFPLVASTVASTSRLRSTSTDALRSRITGKNPTSEKSTASKKRPRPHSSSSSSSSARGAEEEEKLDEDEEMRHQSEESEEEMGTEKVIVSRKGKATKTIKFGGSLARKSTSRPAMATPSLDISHQLSATNLSDEGKEKEEGEKMDEVEEDGADEKKRILAEERGRAEKAESNMMMMMEMMRQQNERFEAAAKASAEANAAVLERIAALEKAKS